MDGLGATGPSILSLHQETKKVLMTSRVSEWSSVPNILGPYYLSSVGYELITRIHNFIMNARNFILRHLLVRNTINHHASTSHLVAVDC